MTLTFLMTPIIAQLHHPLKDALTQRQYVAGLVTFVIPLENIFLVSASTIVGLTWSVLSVARTAPLTTSAPALTSRLPIKKIASSLNVIKNQLVDVLSDHTIVRN